MKKIYLALIASFLCFPLFAQSPAANQVQINKRIFTVGTNTYETDYGVYLETGGSYTIGDSTVSANTAGNGGNDDDVFRQ